ncbi:MAG: DUF1129 domain-containing protein, partial [Atopostipes suicloacalis]|nr:DUF1129 domain-containing protein [Atopostipes suicloacalis]
MSNKKNQNKKEKKVKKKDSEAIKKENEALFLKLTNKNQDYFVQLDRHLVDLSYEEKKKDFVLNQMLLETIDFQEEAITARKMYGRVTERADKILGVDPEMMKETKDISSNKLLYLDGALLLGGMFSLVNGFSAWRSLGVTNGRSLSLVQVIMNFLLGGLVALALTKYKPEAGQTKGMLKYVGVTVGAMLLFVFSMTLADTIIPKIINPILPPLLVLALG